jgi:hypothetical protein
MPAQTLHTKVECVTSTFGAHVCPQSAHLRFDGIFIKFLTSRWLVSIAAIKE